MKKNIDKWIVIWDDGSYISFRTKRAALVYLKEDICQFGGRVKKVKIKVKITVKE